MGKNVVVEGFDNAANWVYRASSYNTTSYIIWQQGSGRFGGHSANCQYNSGAYVRWDYVPDAAIDCTLGFAYYNGIGNIRHYFFDSAGSVQMTIYINTTNGQVTVWRGNQATQIAQSSTGAVAHGGSVWHYLEISVHISTTVGTVTVKVDGATVYSPTGLNNQATGNANVAGVQIGEDGGQYQFLWDDVYVRNDSTFLGEQRVGTTLPASNGDTVNFTPSAGSNYQNVDEAGANGDTDYNYSTTVGDKDLFNVTSTSAGTHVNCVALTVVARKDDTGARTGKTALKTGGTVYNGTAVALPSTYAGLSKLYDQNPNTAADWTLSQAHGAQYGYQLDS